MKVNQGKRDVLSRPVLITIETLDELKWAHKAFADGVNAKGVEKDSAQQKFYTQAHTALNSILAKSRHKDG